MAVQVRTRKKNLILSVCWLLIALATACGISGCSPDSGPAMDDAAPRAGNDATVDGSPIGGAKTDSASTDGSGKADGAGKTDAGEIDGAAQTPATPQPDPTPYLLSEEELADGWISLFDGVSLFGWTEEVGDANWRVEDGVIVADAGEPGFLATTSTFGDYVLKVDFRAAEKTNSGVFLHTPKAPADPERDCYELNIAPADNPFPTGSLVKRQKVEGEHNSADWQTFEVHVLGDTVLVLLNGREILTYTDEHPLWRGHISLQFREGKIEFRKVKLKPLELKPLLEGEDLAGWKKNGDSEFTVNADGELHVKGGKGWLESAEFFGDFVLQLECKTNAPGLNTGVFFRCIPGEEMNGYESQIHNGFKNGDRTQPVDAGTGAIFRRTVARRVVADDLKWLYKTIVADGPHISVWVNGYQVTDWTDTRQPDDNPRRGLRLGPGTLMLQGHDATTDVHFRNLQAREIAARAEVPQ